LQGRGQWLGSVRYTLIRADTSICGSQLG